MWAGEGRNHYRAGWVQPRQEAVWESPGREVRDDRGRVSLEAAGEARVGGCGCRVVGAQQTGRSVCDVGEVASLCQP